jgi:hypothetical protein
MNFTRTRKSKRSSTRRVTVDEAERNKLYEEAEKLLWDDVVFIPLLPERVYVCNNRVGLDEAGLDTTVCRRSATLKSCTCAQRKPDHLSSRRRRVYRLAPGSA